MPFIGFFARAVPYLSAAWKARCGALLHAEHLQQLALHLALYAQGAPIPAFAYFHDRSEPKIDTYLSDFLRLAQAQLSPLATAEALEAIPIAQWLAALGQRITEGSLRDERAIPPVSATLFQRCQDPYNTEISVALRAWEKHVGRSEDPFWGLIRGNPAEKELLVQERIAYILAHRAWWNVFEHEKHGAVYELREPLGHGIRWRQADGQFIGFLEPF